MIVWLEGLSGSGKTTIGESLAESLLLEGMKCELLDGDDLRNGLCSDLGFDPSDRIEQSRRIRYLGKILGRNSIVSIVSAITPYKEIRDSNRKYLGIPYIEVYINTSLEECIKRDVKGLYKKAIAGEIENFTGISDTFDIPENPDIVCNTEKDSVEKCVQNIKKFIFDRRLKYGWGAWC